MNRSLIWLSVTILLVPVLTSATDITGIEELFEKVHNQRQHEKAKNLATFFTKLDQEPKRNPIRMLSNHVHTSMSESHEPAPQAPMLQSPMSQTPMSQAPMSQAPMSQAPAPQVPMLQSPMSQAPMSQSPMLQSPMLQASMSQAPMSQSSVSQAINPFEQIYSQISSPISQPPANLDMIHGFWKYSDNSIRINNYAETGIQVARVLLDSYGNDPNAMQKIAEIKAPPRFCPFTAPLKCDLNYPYRTLDGSCNNLVNVWLGKSEAPYKRWLKPAYADDLNEPRVSVDGSELPNPRDLVCALHSDEYEIEPFVTHIFMQWGQFINHDLTSLSISRDDEVEFSRCNDCQKHGKCLPIPINPNSTCGSQMTHKCIEFTRSSATFPDIHCSIGRREQLNLQTAFLDGSILYGTSEKNLKELRDPQGKGLMKLQPNDLLPMDMTKEPSDCLDFTETERCFKSGDDRVNQNSGLMSIQTLFIREHNRIANILAYINPSWEDETVFQETRRVIIAMIQHITYNEYAPVLLGPKVTSALGLTPEKGYTRVNVYDPNVDPRIANEWAAGAGRFGHSMIRSRYSKLNSKYETAGANGFMLRDSFFRANSLYNECQGGLESVIRGMLKDPLMKVDRHISQELTNNLFVTRDDFGRAFHFDLASLNIARGREHGLPGYTRFRDYCRLPRIFTWMDMKMIIPANVVDTFRYFYRYVDDVDLFPAVLSEFKQEGALVGPTLSCLLGLQFRDTKYGDRFWYETSEAPAAFTPGQLAEIRKLSLSKLLCRTLKNTPIIQPHAMISAKIKENGRINCTDLHDINWEYWRV